MAQAHFHRLILEIERSVTLKNCVPDHSHCFEEVALGSSPVHSLTRPLMTSSVRMAVACAMLAATSPAFAREARAQTGGFVVTLGNDTLHAESFRQSSRLLEGVIVTRVPATRIARYRMTYGTDGRPIKYELTTTDALGTPLTYAGASGSLTFTGDSVVRETLEKGVSASQTLYAPHGAFPSPGLPYIGVSYLMYEQAIAAARLRGDSAIYLLGMFAAQKNPQRSRVWFPASDSAELDYFGVARSGYRFDASGALIRADWRGTTYRYRIARVREIDVEALARAWHDADSRGVGIGALSPRDSSRGVVDGAELSVQYSRPARRGRSVWGDVVKSDVVWRLGADMATHFSTSADMDIGGTQVPAGRYTLWMLLKGDGSGELIVNKRVNIFGTQYDPRADLARIPLQRVDTASEVERMSLSVLDHSLEVAWGNTIWRVPVRRANAPTPAPAARPPATPASGRAAAQSGAVEGVAFDSLRNVPLARATVIVSASPAGRDTAFRSVFTDDQGHFRM